MTNSWSPFVLITLADKDTNRTNAYVVLNYPYDKLPKGEQEIILSVKDRNLSKYVVANFPVTDIRDREVQEKRAEFLYHTLNHQYKRTIMPELNEELLEKVSSGIDRASLIQKVSGAL